MLRGVLFVGILGALACSGNKPVPDGLGGDADGGALPADADGGARPADGDGVARPADGLARVPDAKASDAPPATTCLRNVPVATSIELAAAFAAAKAGDCIVLADGRYAWVQLADKQGSEASPIVIRSAHRGGAVVAEGTPKLLRCTHVVLEGLVFAQQATVTLETSQHCRVTRCRFQLSEVGMSAKDSQHWLVIRGAKSGGHRLDHNLFGPKTHLGNVIAIEGDSRQVSQHDVIDHNHFRAIGPRPSENGMDTIRVGSSGISLSSAYATIEHNLFEDCDGDWEIVSIKSCDNTVRANTFRRSQGTVTARHGNRNEISANFFFGENKAGTGGIRLYGDDHRVWNNYMEGLAGSGKAAALAIDSGDFDTSAGAPVAGDLAKHFRVRRAIVAFNTLVNNTSSIEIARSAREEPNSLSYYPYPPVDVLVANNLLVGRSGMLIREFVAPTRLRYVGNLAWPTGDSSVGVIRSSWGDPEIRMADPRLTLRDGVQRPGAQSALLDAAMPRTELAWLDDDMDGQPRVAPFDVGADEVSAKPVLRRPLSAREVGPDAP